MTDLAVASVHDALQEALISKRRYKREPKENLTIRMDPRKKVLLNEIFAANGTNPSDYFRACGDCLIKDYIGPKAFAQLEAQLAKVAQVE